MLIIVTVCWHLAFMLIGAYTSSFIIKKRKSVEHFDPFLFIGESEVTDHEVTVLSVSKICGSSKFITWHCSKIPVCLFHFLETSNLGLCQTTEARHGSHHRCALRQTPPVDNCSVYAFMLIGTRCIHILFHNQKKKKVSWAFWTFPLYWWIWSHWSWSHCVISVQNLWFIKIYNMTLLKNTYTCMFHFLQTSKVFVRQQRQLLSLKIRVQNQQIRDC